VVTDHPTTRDRRDYGGLLDRADAERAAGRGEAAVASYREAAQRCRAADDLAGWARAVLGLASAQDFESEPGLLPAELFEVYARVDDDPLRARLAAALARCWVYAGHAARAVPFAEEAMDLAGSVDDPLLMADSLDAALAAHWGPDDLDRRRELARELDDVTAHLGDAGAQLRARLWGLQVACEHLDVPGMHRQMRGLEVLGERFPLASFFAASRRLMLDLLRGRTDTVDRLCEIAEAAAAQVFVPDGWKVLEVMRGFTAVQSGDVGTCARSAARAEEYATAEGVPTVTAEAAVLWLGADRPDRARQLVGTLDGVLDGLPRDVNWLLIQQLTLQVAVAVDHMPVIEQATRLLAPYEGRAVINAGAVLFHGITDDPLSRAHEKLGDHQTAARLRSSALATYERIGAQWWRDRLLAGTAAATATVSHDRLHLHPTDGGLWVVGPDGGTVVLPALRGLGYLRELLRRPGHDVPALDLVAGALGHRSVWQGDLGEIIDTEARAAYARRLQELDDEIAEARDWNDTARLDARTLEQEALLAELTRATGLGGASRAAGSSSERARVAVRKAIVGALARVARADAQVARHLNDRVRTGSVCRYDPDPDHPVEWVLS
jgi:tetratricopeptide (TPR) repeat protein